MSTLEYEIFSYVIENPKTCDIDILDHILDKNNAGNTQSLIKEFWDIISDLKQNGSLKNLPYDIVLTPIGAARYRKSKKHCMK